MTFNAKKNLELLEKQIVSRKRVAAHGEVYTGKREVNTMLDLVKHETERIDSRFLAPACGNGNFLTVILERKLAVVEKRYGRSQLDFERYAILAITSLYGIDILEDNVRYCQLKSDWGDFLSRASNLNPEQSMSYEFVSGLVFGQIHLT